MAKKARNYKKEYADYHGTAVQKKRRAERNRDRASAEKRFGEAALRGKEVDHVGSHRTGSLAGVKTKVISKKANRKKQPKRGKNR
jgi:hypothetical protein